VNCAIRKIALSLCGLLILWGLTGHFLMGVATADDALKIHQTATKEIDVHHKAQQAEEQWADQKDKLVAQYEALLDKKERLEKHYDVLVAELDACSARVAEAERKTIGTAKVRARMQSTLESIVSRLAAFIETDLPFLATERSRRLTELKALLSRPDESLAEKCRRTLEALQVEVEYGRSFQVSEETITLDDRSIAVDIVRAGRLALFFRTPDGQTAGWYDRAAEKWQPLPAKYERSINQAAEMALHRRPMDLVKLPLGRIEVP
jgi:chromosome segregation ATPase